MEKLLFLINPKSGTDKSKKLSSIIHKELDGVFEIDIRYTEYAGHATELAKEAVGNNYRGVVAVGGDGSVNEVAQALVGTEVCLGILPKGSGNGLARSLHIDINVKDAIKTIKKNVIEKIDVGCVNDTHYFMSNLGVGFDVKVSKDFRQTNFRGIWGYAKVVLNNLMGYKPKKYTLQIDGKKPKKIRSFLLNIANAEQFGYNFRIAPDADLQDGILNIVSIKKFPLWKGGSITLKAFNGTIYKSRYTKSWKGRKVILKGKKLKYYQVDGDLVKNDTPGTVHVTIVPLAINVFKP